MNESLCNGIREGYGISGSQGNRGRYQYKNEDLMGLRQKSKTTMLMRGSNKGNGNESQEIL